MRGLDGIDLRGHRVGDADVACALGAQDAEAHDGRAVETGEGPRLGDGVGDEAEIVEPDFAAVRQRDLGRGEIDERLGAGERADRLLAAADLGAAAGEIDVAAAQLPADVERGQADGLQPDRIEADADFALDRADQFDAADAAHALQRADDDILDEPGELLRRLARRDRRVGEDRQAGDVDALNHRLVDAARQVGAHARHRVLDVVERAVGIGLQPERDRRGGDAVGDRRGDVVDALDAGDRVFDRSW